jgi:hypothetical protein
VRADDRPRGGPAGFIVALVVVVASPLRRSTRVWAVVLVLPMWWLAQQVVDGLLHETVIG